MSQWVLSNFLTCLTTFSLAIFVFLYNRKAKVNRIFCLYSLSISEWSFFTAFHALTTSKSLSLFSARIMHLGVPLIPILFFHFCLVILDKYNEHKNKLFIGYIISGALIIANFTSNSIVLRVRPKLGYHYFMDGGILYPLLILNFAIYTVLGIYLLLKASMTCSGNKRNQLRYLLGGSLLGYIFGVSCFLPVYDVVIFPYPFGSYSISAYIVITTYAIIKYRLMDIALVWRQILMFTSYLLAAGGVSVLVFLSAHSYPVISAVIVFILLLTAPFTYRFLHRFSQPFVDQVILKGKYNSWNELDKLKKAELGYISEQIAWNLVGGISEIMQVDRISFFLYVANRREFRPYAQIGLDNEIGTEQIPWVTLPPDSHLVKHLFETKQLVIKDEIAGSNNLVEEMEHIYAEISIPLFVQEELIGILNLGPKPDKEMYHQEELKKITDLCSQAENHLSHARFMENRATFSRQLAHDMKNLVAKNIEPTFAELCETKDEKKRQELLNTVFNQHQYLKICLKNNFDLVSLVERLAYHKYILEPAQIAQVITACSQLYKTPCAKVGISIEQDVPKNLPEVLVNREDIPKVFNNLFDNALKFTPSGGKIKIKAEQKGDEEVLVIFSDTGRGMSEEKLKTIFEPNVKMPDNEVPDNEESAGTGLGLVIIKDIIEAQGGRIWVKSELGKGTTFYFTLRIAKEEKNNDKEV